MHTQRARTSGWHSRSILTHRIHPVHVVLSSDRDRVDFVSSHGDRGRREVRGAAFDAAATATETEKVNYCYNRNLTLSLLV